MKSYTDLEQSKKLAEILPLESADMYYFSNKNCDSIDCGFDYTKRLLYVDYEGGVPCWSLAALLNILPKIQGGKPIIALDDNYITYPLPHRSDLHTKADNPVDACVKMIVKLHELKML